MGTIFNQINWPPRVKEQLKNRYGDVIFSNELWLWALTELANLVEERLRQNEEDLERLRLELASPERIEVPDAADADGNNAYVEKQALCTGTNPSDSECAGPR